MVDEKYFLQAFNEYENGEIDKALWIKSLSLENGNDATAKFRYIRERANKLLKAENNESMSVEKNIYEENANSTNGENKQDKDINLDDEPVEAGAWQRFFARILDTWIAGTIVLMLTFMLALTVFSSQLNNPFFMLLFLFITLLSVFLFDALVYLLFSNTLGKKLLGLMVVDKNGHKLRASNYMGRNMKVWAYGFAYGLPIVHLLFWLRECNRVNKNMPASYDEESGDKVVSEGANWFKVILYIIVFIFVLVISGMVNEVANQITAV